MKISYRHMAVLCVFSFGVGTLWAQSDGRPERTPEQEAAKQTETMQRELDLSPEQVTRIHEINLKYAEERQDTDTRTEAMERMRRKNEDYKRVLDEAQYEHLQSKRVERRTRPLDGRVGDGRMTTLRMGTPAQSQRSQPRSITQENVNSTGRQTENLSSNTRQSSTAVQNRNSSTSIRINSTSSNRPPVAGGPSMPPRQPAPAPRNSQPQMRR